MASAPVTLFDYLTQPNPTFSRAQPCLFSKKKPGRPSKNQDKLPIPKGVRTWTEFNLPTLRKAFDGKLADILQQNVDGLHDFSNIHPAFLEVYDENALDSLLVKSHQSIVLEALRVTAPALLQQEVAMVRGGQAILVLDRSHRFAPDWAGIGGLDRDDDIPKPNNILPGDTKTSWSWHSSFIRRNKADATYESEWPLRQLLNYCLLTFSRYGYIITDKELVVVRLSCDLPESWSTSDPGELKEIYEEHTTMEYRSVPWESVGESNSLTMNLALWALHILAANNGHIQSSPYQALADEVTRSCEDRVALAMAGDSYDMSQPLSFESACPHDGAAPVTPNPEPVVEYATMDEGDTEPDDDQVFTSNQNSFASIGSGRSQRSKGRRQKRCLPASNEILKVRSRSKVVKAAGSTESTSFSSRTKRGKAKVSS